MEPQRECSAATGELIYIVDDEPAVRALFALCLRRVGWRVEAFSDSAAALVAFSAAETKPALVIADFDMAGMNGLELLKRCKAALPALKTMSCSGTLMEEDLRQADFQPDELLSKPCGVAEFCAVVAKLLAGGSKPFTDCGAIS